MVKRSMLAGLAVTALGARPAHAADAFPLSFTDEVALQAAGYGQCVGLNAFLLILDRLQEDPMLERSGDAARVVFGLCHEVRAPLSEALETYIDQE